MTDDESMPEFKPVFNVCETPNLPEVRTTSPRILPVNDRTVISNKKWSPSRGFQHCEQNGVVEGKETAASPAAGNHYLEDGECDVMAECTEKSAPCNSHTEASIKETNNSTTVITGSSHKRKSKPTKLQKPRRKSETKKFSYVDSILQPKLIAPHTASSPVMTPAPITTTDTMIKSIPELFKNASIATEIPQHPIKSFSCEKDSSCCEPLKDDIAFQINSSVLPKLTLPCPPERFNMPIVDQGYRCIDCGDHFWVESSMTQHLQRRSIYIAFNCSACKKQLIFYNRCTMLGHIRVHHSRNQVTDIRQATVSPLPHDLIPCIQEQATMAQRAQDTSSSDSKTKTTPVVTIIIPPNSDDIFTVTTPNQRTSGKSKCPECHCHCGSSASLREHFGSDKSSPPERGTTCLKCSMLCPTWCSLMCHQRIHIQNRPYICPECGQDGWDTWDDFQQHVAIDCLHYSRTVGFQCTACNQLSLSLEQLRQHVISSHSEAYYKCQACPMAFRAEGTFHAHRKMVHAMDRLQCSTIRKCPLCEVVFQSNDVLQNHLENHFSEASKSTRFIFTCIECNQLFENKNSLAYHLQTFHQALFYNGEEPVSDDPCDKSRLKLPKKRARSASSPKPTPPQVVLKPKIQKVRILKDRTLKSKAPKPESSHEPGAEAASGTARKDEPRIPPLVLSLKDRTLNHIGPSLVVKKKKKSTTPSNGLVCEDCGRVFTTDIGCRVHRQRTHNANYRVKKAFRLTLERKHKRHSTEKVSLDSELNVASEMPLEPDVASRQTALAAKPVKRRRSSPTSTNVGPPAEVPSTEEHAQSESSKEQQSSPASTGTTCGECGRIFPTAHGCNVHKQRCHGTDNLKSKCAVCQEFLPDPHQMAEHGQGHLKEGTLVCTLCNNLVFSTKLGLAKHIENHAINMEYPLACSLCYENLDSSDVAAPHWRSEHGLLSYHCPKCDSQYLYKKSLNRHIQIAHGTASKKRQAYTCNHCDVPPFSKASLLQKHVEAKHPVPREGADIDPDPGLSVEENDSELTKLYRSSTPVEQLETSGGNSPGRDNVNSPVPKPGNAKIEDAEDAEVYSCAKCDFIISDRQEFQAHIIAHKTELDSYQCLECGTCFVVEPSLRKHLTCSHKVRNLETFMDERGYNTGSAAGLGELPEGGIVTNGNGSNDSQADGTNGSSLKCSVCLMQFDTDSALKIHIRTHGMAFIRSKRTMNSQGSEQASSPNVTPTKIDV